MSNMDNICKGGQILRIICSLSLVSISVAELYVFWNILIHGSITFYEPNIIILSIEIIIPCFLLVFGVLMFYSDLIEHKKSRRSDMINIRWV